MPFDASLSRRGFLGLTAGLPFASALTSLAQKKTPPIGLELYSVRTELGKDLPGTVDRVAKMGYQVVEFYSPYYEWSPEAAKTVRKQLDDLGITCRSTHNGPVAFTPEGIKKAIELNQIIGSTTVVMASPGRVTDLADWEGVAARLTEAADTLKAAGMRAGYHNHQTEWKPVGDKRPMDVLAANTPKDVTLQFDIGTCLEAGADPVAWIQANPGRIRSMHCKEWSKANGYAVAFAEGDAPWKAILDAAEATGGIEYYLIEQEQSPEGQQFQMAERCLDNWKKLRA